MGSNNSLVAPHLHELGIITPGKHRLSIRIDNGMILPYRPDGHSVSDSEGNTWNGIAGKIELLATTPVWIEDAQTFPNVTKKSVRIKVRVGNAGGQAGSGTLSAGGVKNPITWDEKEGRGELDVPLKSNVQTWDEFHPVLQRLTLQLEGDHADDARELVFGLREIKTEGKEFLLNGRAINLRGTHLDDAFPLTGYPATDVDSWKRIIGTCQAWGFNHVRFHSWCPPEADFVAADELGCYLQVECGMWNSFTPGGEMDRMLEVETERIIKAYGNHPSFLLLAPSNEPSGDYANCLSQWVSRWKARDPRRLFTLGTGRAARPDVDTSQYHVMAHTPQGMLRSGQGWFGKDFEKSVKQSAMPVLAHEVGQWCAYPDFDLIKKFTGYLRPGNLEIFRDSLAAHGMLERDKAFAWASGRFQLECYKEDIEANLRTPDLAGFQLLELHDNLGQGTSLVGLLDPFWEPKDYVQAGEFRHFCNTTVPLARLQKRVFTTAETFDAEVEVYHYGAAPITRAVAVWEITNDRGEVVTKGEWPARTILIGKGIPLGRVAVDLSKVAAPQAYKLSVKIKGTSFENDWGFWVYPDELKASAPQDVLVTGSWAAAQEALAAGGKVLFEPAYADLNWSCPPLGTTPIFWNHYMWPAWSRMMGLCCDTNHPALAEFPTEANFDWQWSELMEHTRGMNLDGLPRQLQPIVQAIDDWNRNWKLAVVFECAVGSGKLLVCSADVESDLAKRPAARQLRQSLVDYAASARFQPQVAVSVDDMSSLLFDTGIMRKLQAMTVGDEGTRKAIDGDPNSFWQAGAPEPGAEPKAREPHELTIGFPMPVPMNGIVCVPRQSHREHEGAVRGYTVQVSDDGQQWTEVARGEFPCTFDPQRVLFAKTVSSRYLKFTALSGFGSDPSAALAELAVIYAGPKPPEEKLEARRVAP